MSGFVHLRCHSHYSLLSGANTIEELIEACRQRGMSALALTDTDALYGAVTFYREAVKGGIKPIIGVDITEKKTGESDTPVKRVVVLAKNMAGYSQLCRLVTARQLDNNFSLPEAARHAACGDLFVLCQDVELLAILAGRVAPGSLYVELNYFGDRESGRKLRELIRCAQRLKLPVVATNNAHFIDPEGYETHKVLAAIGANATVSTTPPWLLASPEAWLVPPEVMAKRFAEFPEALKNSLKIADQCHWELDLGKLKFPEFTPPAPHTPASYLRKLALAGTRNRYTSYPPSPQPSPTKGEGAPACSQEVLLPPQPNPPSPESEGESLSNNLVESGFCHSCEPRIGVRGRRRNPPLRPLWKASGFPRIKYPVSSTGQAKAGLVKSGMTVIGQPREFFENQEKVLGRLEYELKIINDLGFATYFLIVWDIVRYARRKGIPTIGRGSAANSLVCYSLGITHVDPLKHNLYFERFLNPDRADCPDIDLDFPWNRRDEVLQYVYDRYGREHVAMISTFVRFRGRSTIREIGKALGVPKTVIDRVASRLPFFSDVSHLEEIRQVIPECRGLPLEEEPYKTILRLGRRIEGYPRHLSIHCGGIVISPTPITDLVPLERSGKGLVITQFDMYPVEDLGLIKIDLLGQRSLAVLVDTLEAVKKHYKENRTIRNQKITDNRVDALITKGGWMCGLPYGITPDFRHIDPVSDPATRRLVKTGQSMGCFYIESPGMRNLLKKLQVDSFETLVAASSVIRPGVSNSGMMKAFINRYKGKEKASYLHPKMEEVLGETLGVMVYQEDVIKVANAVAGMSLAEADSLRKCMSKKRGWESMNNYRKRFLTGAQANGVALEIAKEIWRQIESFGGYAFCKAHSASFAQLSYQMAYLKAHFPAEFMAAVLTNQGGFYHPSAYIEEARRMGLTILLPHINRSEHDYRAESNSSPPTLILPHKGGGDTALVGFLPSPLAGEGQGEEVLNDYPICPPPSPTPFPLKGERKKEGREVHSSLAPVSGERVRACPVVDTEVRAYTKSCLGQTRNAPAEIAERSATARCNAIRIGLMQVKGLTGRSIESIVAARKEKPFSSLTDFCRRSGAAYHEARSLILCGAMDCFGLSRPLLLWQLELLKAEGEIAVEKAVRLTHEITMSPCVKDPAFDEETLEQLQTVAAHDFSWQEKLKLEEEFLDLAATAHPLSLYRGLWQGKGVVEARDLSKYMGKRVKLAGWIITAQRTRTVKGEYMKFVTMEDLTASFEVTFFPNAYRRCGHLLVNGRGPYLVGGRVENDDGALTLTADSLVFLLKNSDLGIPPL